MENTNGNRGFNEKNYKSNGFKEITDEELALVSTVGKKYPVLSREKYPA